MAVVSKFEKNMTGRDFTVGDIHGCFSVLEEALEAASFDRRHDRLICVGDLVNRGPESERALEFLKQNWFFTVRGNHEQDIAQDFEIMNAKGKDAVRDEFERHGLGWMLSLDKIEQKEFIDAFKALPYAIEVPLKTGELVGFTHAEIPKGLSWQDFTQKLEEGDEKVLQTALLGRSRITQAFKNGFDTDSGVTGISKLFTGHSIAYGRGASRMGNWFCIDTGVAMRHAGTEGMVPERNPEDFHLSLMDIRAEANELDRKKPLDDNRPYHVIHASRP
jgi:serine/threonine protein phosphatase 1